MPTIRNNRDLYQVITALVALHRGRSPPLVEYLRALLDLFRSLADRPALDPDTFARVLGEAFAGRPDARAEVVAAEGFAAVEAALNGQVRDLLAMKANGTLENEERYFGVDAPSRMRWYNFDPLTYLECGVQGAFGGWQVTDDTGRMPVPGQVAMLDERDEIVAVDPADLPDDVEPIDVITWEDVERFLHCGRTYE
jgi:hypothetical protein